jgi:hypothetical protein
MDRNAYDQMIATAIDEAIESIGEGRPSPARLRHALEVLAKRSASLSRDYHLLNLTTADELAERWGVTRRAVQMLAKRRHERFGAGMMIGNKWVFDVDELPLLEQDLRRKAE